MPTKTESPEIQIPIPVPTPMPAPTQTQLETGLGGAIGCDFLATASKNELIFVEFSGKLSALSVAPATPAYTVLGAGYNQPEDVKLSSDGVHAYVVERSGDLVRVSLASANRSSATVIASGMTAPQQLFLDEAHNAAYVVEFAPSGRLLKINLTSGAISAVFSGLQNAVGLVLTSDLQYAYVSEQMTGGSTGRISAIQLSSASRTTIATGLTAPFFLTWADQSEDSLFVPQRDPSNSIARVDVTNSTWGAAVSGVPFRPSSVALLNASQILVCCDSVIDEVSFLSFSGAPLLMGIGLIPYNFVNSSGLATTPANSPYQVTAAPFGGTLPIMVNYQAAGAAGAAYYQVTVDGVVQTGTWTVFQSTGIGYALVSVPSETVGSTIGLYPVHPGSELFNYQPAALGYELDSTILSNSTHTIELFFFDSSGHLLPGVTSEIMTVLVNNQSCVATLSPALIETTPPATANACGVLNYNPADEAVTVSLAYTASQPQNFGFYNILISRGVTPVSLIPPLPSGTPVSSGGSSITATVSALLSTACPTAGFGVELYVAATMTNGWNRQSQYDAEALMGFVLTPGP
jgi:hypothetical protein